MTKRWLIGLSAGSTVDGVDAVLVETEGIGMELRLTLRQALHQPYPRDLRELIVRTSSAQATMKQACLLHRVLGETLANAARQVADQASFSLQRVQVIGCQPHTIWHEPDGRYPSTLTLGMPAVLAERTGITVVGDFRTRDLAIGGQGMPLTALVDYLLFRHPQEGRALVHLGGISNVVWLPPGAGPRTVLGFQAGPCNVLIDGLMSQVTGGRETYDAGGKHAVQGTCIEPLLERWLAHPLLQRKPPKSIPRHEFGEEFIVETLRQARTQQWTLHDLLCTATHLVARSIADALARFLPARPERLMLSGGGIRNGLLWQLIAQHTGAAVLESTDVHGIPSRSRKAIGFAGLAALTLDGVPGNLNQATGAAGTRLLGNLTPGTSANWARCLTWMAQQTLPLAAAG